MFHLDNDEEIYITNAFHMLFLCQPLFLNKQTEIEFLKPEKSFAKTQFDF